MIQKLKKLHFFIRLLLALAIAFGWMFIAYRFQTGIVFLSIPLDWIISGAVLIFIYNLLLSPKNSKPK